MNILKFWTDKFCEAQGKFFTSPWTRPHLEPHNLNTTWWWHWCIPLLGTGDDTDAFPPVLTKFHNQSFQHSIKFTPRTSCSSVQLDAQKKTQFLALVRHDPLSPFFQRVRLVHLSQGSLLNDLSDCEKLSVAKLVKVINQLHPQPFKIPGIGSLFTLLTNNQTTKQTTKQPTKQTNKQTE